MLILLSPAKSLDFEPTGVGLHTQPAHLDDSDELIGALRERSVDEVAKLMSLSPKLAEMNVERYRAFARPFVLNQGAKQALLAFKGDVYRDWPHAEYSDEDFDWAQRHLRILSGLYGALRPLDLIQPYRLEMGTRLKTARGRNLYDFWGHRITEALNAALAEQEGRLVVNLASNEYFKSVRRERLTGDLVSPTFRDWKSGQYKIISFFAKRARGMMAHWLIANRVLTREAIDTFDLGGYRHDPITSTHAVPVFVRGGP